MSLKIDQPSTTKTTLQEAPVTETKQPSSLDKTRAGDISGTGGGAQASSLLRPALAAPAMSAAAMAIALSALTSKLTESRFAIAESNIVAHRAEILATAAKRATMMDAYFSLMSGVALSTQSELGKAIEKDMAAYVNSRMPTIAKIIPGKFGDFIRNKLTDKFKADYMRNLGSNMMRVAQNLFSHKMMQAGLALGIGHLSLMRDLVPAAKLMTSVLAMTFSTTSAMRELRAIMRNPWMQHSPAMMTIAATTLAMAGFAHADRATMRALERLMDADPHMAAALATAMTASMLTVAAGAVMGLRSEAALFAVTAKTMATMAALVDGAKHHDFGLIDFAGRFTAERALFSPMFSGFADFMTTTHALFLAAATVQARHSGI